VDGQVYAVWDPPEGGDITDPTAEISAMYWQLLDRAPDQAGLSFWVNAVESGQATIQDVYNDIINSDEYKQLHSGDGSGGGGDPTPPPDPGPTSADLVTQAYQSLLGRTPSASELSYWTSAMDKGMSIFDVEAQMQSSPEYENRKATSPDAGNFDPKGNVIVNYRPGDTLQGLAQAAYGDPSLAYLIASANGITAGSQLASLKTVVIPKAGGTTFTTKTQAVSAGAGTSTQGTGQMQGAHADAGAGGTTYMLMGGAKPDARQATLLDIMNHVGWFQEEPSIPTTWYVQAYGVYKQLQGGATLSEFVNKDYDSIVHRIAALNTGHPGHPADMVAPDVAPIYGHDMSNDQFGASTGGSIPGFSQDVIARTDANPLLGAMYRDDHTGTNGDNVAGGNHDGWQDSLDAFGNVIGNGPLYARLPSPEYEDPLGMNKGSGAQSTGLNANDPQIVVTGSASTLY
jgi:hypothetical protein